MDKTIIFSTPMIKSIYDDRKKQTRRIAMCPLYIRKAIKEARGNPTIAVDKRSGCVYFCRPTIMYINGGKYKAIEYEPAEK